MLKRSLWMVVPSLVAGLAQASSRVEIAEFSSDGLEVRGLRYVARPESNRAWVDIKVYERACYGGEGCDPDGYIRAKVPGMSYDPATQAVVAEDGTVCTTYLSKHIGPIKYKKEKVTGFCGYEVQNSSRTIDDGFDVRVEKTFKVFFTTR